jgi:hypothetical protein
VERDGGAVELARASEPEVPGRVRIVHIEAEADFEARAVEATLADDPSVNVTQSDLPLVLTRGEAQGIAERWLVEARVARDTVRFALPPSSEVGAGDLVELHLPGASRIWRIDRIEEAGARQVQAVRVEPGVQRPTHQPGDGPRARQLLSPAPVIPVFLDLPLLSGPELAHAPHLAVAGTIGSGGVAVFEALPGEDFRLNRVVDRHAAIGFTLTALPRAASGRWDRGGALRVRMLRSALESVGEEAVFAGRNAMAIGDGTPGNWEILQFAEAELVEPEVWEISLRLRGQLGTDAVMPDAWPPSSLVVLLDEDVGQIETALGARGLARRYRVGPATRPHTDPAFVEVEAAFDGMGLRPYAPAHLRALPAGDGGLEVTWIRRTRIDGDSWVGIDVPLGEDLERYLVRVTAGASLLRQAEVSSPRWTYSAAERAADGATPPFRIGVAQLSQAFGPGPFTEIDVHE